MMMAALGSIRVEIIRPNSSFFPTNLNLANPYATMLQETMVINTAGMTILKELIKNVVKVYWPLPFHPFRYASRL